MAIVAYLSWQDTFSFGKARNAPSIQELQALHFERTGRYLQVMKGNALPHYEHGNVATKLGRNLPTNTQVTTYETPTGERGYQVLNEDADNWYSVGYGPEAQSRTYTWPKPKTTGASSTSSL